MIRLNKKERENEKEKEDAGSFLVIVVGGCIWWWNKYYRKPQLTTGTIKEVCWSCFSQNKVYGIDDASPTAELNRRTSGNGRVAHCFTVGDFNWARNLVQVAMFTITLDTPLGRKIARSGWRRRFSSKEDFELPLKNISSPKKIITTRAGSDATILE